MVRSDVMSRSVIDSIGTPGIYVNYKLGYNKSELALKKPHKTPTQKTHERFFVLQRKMFYKKTTQDGSFLQNKAYIFCF